MSDITLCSTAYKSLSREEALEGENKMLKEKLRNLEKETKEKSYFMLASQEGEGCDYTIACGKYYCELSSDLDDAKEEAKEYIEDHSGSDLEELIILEVTKVIKKVFPKKEWEE